MKLNILRSPDGDIGGAGVQPEPPPTNAAPTGWVSPATLKAQIEKARMEERSHLQAQMSEGADRLKLVDSRNISLETEFVRLQKEVATLTQTNLALTASVKDGAVDIEALVASTLKSTEDRMKQAYDGRLSEMQTSLVSLSEENKQAKADKLRASMILAAGGSEALMPEIVTGNTQSEIALSIEASKALFQKYNKASISAPVTPQKTPDDNASGGGVGLPALPVAQPGNSSPLAQGGNVRAMSDKEWRANRERILASASGRYKGQTIS